jgi:hypothetical protein
MRWKFSHLRNMSAPASRFKVREVITGVSCATDLSLSAAALIFSIMPSSCITPTGAGREE